jgi:hypothetical protein
VSSIKAGPFIRARVPLSLDCGGRGAALHPAIHGAINEKRRRPSASPNERFFSFRGGEGPGGPPVIELHFSRARAMGACNGHKRDNAIFNDGAKKVGATLGQTSLSCSVNLVVPENNLQRGYKRSKSSRINGIGSACDAIATMPTCPV